MRPYYWFFIWIGGLMLLLFVIRPSVLDAFLYRLGYVVESLLVAGVKLGVLVIGFRVMLSAGKR